MLTPTGELTQSKLSSLQRCLSIPLQKLSRELYVKDKRIILFARPEEIRSLQPEDGITVRRAGSEDWEKLLRMRPKLKKLFTRFRNDNLPVIIALFRDTIVGYSCFEFQPEQPFYRFIALLPKDAWIHDSYILPSFRGRGVLSMMYACKAELLRARGIRNVYVDIPIGNLPSINAHEKLGFREINRMIYTKCFLSEGIRFAYPSGDHFPWVRRTTQPRKSQNV